MPHPRPLTSKSRQILLCRSSVSGARAMTGNLSMQAATDDGTWTADASTSALSSTFTPFVSPVALHVLPCMHVPAQADDTLPCTPSPNHHKVERPDVLFGRLEAASSRAMRFERTGPRGSEHGVRGKSKDLLQSGSTARTSVSLSHG